MSCVYGSDNGSSSVTVLKFSANLTFLFPDDPASKYRMANEAEFSAVEWGNDIYEHPIHELVELNKDLKLQHVLINMFTGSTKGLACLPGRFEEFRQCLELSIEYCNNLKCKKMHIMAGQYLTDTEITDEMKQSYHETFVSNLKFASERLALENITILIEPISTIDNYFLTSSKQAIEIIKEVDCPNLMLQLDLFHQQQTDGNLTETINEYFNNIGHIQISQVPDRSEPDDNGEINYKYIFKLLQRLGYSQWIGCEYTPTLGPDTFDWMKPYFIVPDDVSYAELQEKMQTTVMS